MCAGPRRFERGRICGFADRQRLGAAACVSQPDQCFGVNERIRAVVAWCGVRRVIVEHWGPICRSDPTPASKGQSATIPCRHRRRLGSRSLRELRRLRWRRMPGPRPRLWGRSARACPFAPAPCASGEIISYTAWLRPEGNLRSAEFFSWILNLLPGIIPNLAAATER